MIKTEQFKILFTFSYLYWLFILHISLFHPQKHNTEVFEKQTLQTEYLF